MISSVPRSTGSQPYDSGSSFSGSSFPSYSCPLCQMPLFATKAGLGCENGHQFDKAKEGYFNLLPVQKKKSKAPGDNKEMVIARREFLESGHYVFLQQALAEKVQQLTSVREQDNKLSSGNLVDLGCGEGFYTQAIKALNPQLNVYGLDISKPTIKYAAKRNSQIDGGCHFAVASTKQAPFKTGFADIAVSVFAPLFENEIARLLAPSDNEHAKYLVAVTPGPRHLHQLKALIYQEVRPHNAIDAPKGFERTEQTLLENTVSLNIDEVRHLIMMTPFAWKFRPEHWNQLEACESIEVSLAFYLEVFKRR